MIQRILDYFEKQSFGVMEWWGKKLGVRAARIRLLFIYVSFLTFGSPLIVYLIMAFVLEHKEMFKFGTSRKTIWDL